MKYEQKRTLIHMLALPAQLRKSLARSFLLKKRSSTDVRGAVSLNKLESTVRLTIGTSRIDLHSVLHLAAKEGRHCFWLASD